MTARVAISPLAYVTVGREAVGHVLARGRAGFTWDGPSWRASAKDYHEQRASRRTSETRRAEAQIEARAEILRLLVRQ